MDGAGRRTRNSDYALMSFKGNAEKGRCGKGIIADFVKRSYPKWKELLLTGLMCVILQSQ
jgi:hypothetical protein